MDNDSSSDWYVLGAHTRRAIGYLSVALVERGLVPANTELSQFLDLWGEALQATMEVNERSPIGAESS